MLKKIIGIVLLLVSYSVDASYCELRIDENPKLHEELGNIKFDEFSYEKILVNKSHGDIISRFDNRYLYKLTNEEKIYYFRFQVPIFAENQTLLVFAQWFNNTLPKPGTYKVESFSTKKDRAFAHTMVTIGDSITWNAMGKYMRCMFLDAGIKYDFLGTKIDSFGYPHEGVGKAYSSDPIKRINEIPTADNYFILLGTNDLRLTAAETLNNLITLAYALLDKNPEAQIYISTLLPRNPISERNIQVNNMLLSQYWGKNIKILDIGGDIYKMITWPSYFVPDGLHPTFTGYQWITWYLSKYLGIKGARRSEFGKTYFI